MVDAHDDSTYQRATVAVPPGWMRPVSGWARGGPKCFADVVADAVAAAEWVPLRYGKAGWASLTVEAPSDVGVARAADLSRGVVAGLVGAGVLPSKHRLLAVKVVAVQAADTLGGVRFELRDWGRPGSAD